MNSPSGTASPVVFVRFVSDKAAKTLAKPVVNLRVGRYVKPVSSASEAAATIKPWKLRPVLDLISAKAGGGFAGQLLVYKVFLQLPPDLLQAAGLSSLNAVDEDFVVTHPELRTAIIEAAQRHAGVDVSV